ncbi:M28 Zn-Peptidase-like protein, partial [Leptotrombidium deliense]
MITFYKRLFPKERFAFKFCENRVRNSRITLTLLFTGVILFFGDCFVGNANRIDEIDFHAHKIKFQDSIAKEIEKSLVLSTIHDDELIHKEFLHHWFYSPKVEATIESINETLLSLFSKQRSTEYNAEQKESIRNNITSKLASFGLQIITQDFVIRSIRPKPLYGQNIIAILPGKFRGTSNDVITVIGAHYDTVEQCPGVDDNGSGATAVMETAKVLSTRRVEFNDTLIFALFDLEEW